MNVSDQGVSKSDRLSPLTCLGVIVRPQVIHVARPVLVDRPVPVTQRPIIIDRERPVPVPLRGGGQGAAQASTSRVSREEFAYQDNVPKAYGGRCAEFTGEANYGYVPSQEDNQYAASSTQEASAAYESHGADIDIAVPNQFHHDQSAGQVNVEESSSSYHESYQNIVQSSNMSGYNTAPLHCTGPIEVLDPAVNSSWQRTDQSSLVNRYGRPAYDIVQKTDQVEQQMYHELRQRSSSGGIQRSGSAASYTSGSGGGISGAGISAGDGSFSSIHLGDIQNLNPEGLPHRGPAPISVRINY